ncbi:MAG: NnrS family protein [Pseudomonadota bacterium]
MSTAALRRAYDGPALFSFGFRPFFLFGSTWGALVVPLWLWSLFAGGPAGFTRDWHVHEMLFGFLAAIVAGFLTTAVPNWTGRMPVVGRPLAGLATLWAAGRLAMLFAEALGPVAAIIDSAFLVVFAGVIWREVLAGRNWRNLPVCGLVALLAGANIAFHLNGALLSPAGERAALAAAATLLALIGGRITPSFTRNWMKARGLGPEPAAFGLVDRLALSLTVAGGAAWAIAPQSLVAGGLLLAAGAALAARLARWRVWRTAAEPLVWILHLGYGWLALALALLGATALWPDLVPRSAGIHALTVGAVGVMTLAVMTRASRGHTGRPLAADAGALVIYTAINLAAATRLAAPFAGEAQAALLALSAALWTLAFGGFAATYGRMLTTPRPRAA